ncbi:uncharacterized protein H6S33_005598 [Morchella sextelata]|uniref:uncharacterized protein n=1 Tax=Morchella sextelata TaxID=1174677 RepID=UPI001D0438CC|nr:uncharacterized protein H6S33_005598 [Morchella sextelata]KAH0613712.1 hypothetical protein H6S33_005598 [Morchella sextelata]
MSIRIMDCRPEWRIADPYISLTKILSEQYIPFLHMRMQLASLEHLVHADEKTGSLQLSPRIGRYNLRLDTAVHLLLVFFL